MHRINEYIDAIIARALEEDIGERDVTTACILPPNFPVSGEFIAKEPGIIAGLNIARRVFIQRDGEITFDPTVNEGDSVEAGTIIATISGSGHAILSGERVALNFLQRQSGIATLTRRYVEAIKGTKAVILDTRKTIPGMRTLDKEAVRLGGGQNHRFGLFDMVLIKDNHIAAAGGSISEAVRRVRARDAKKHPIELEVRTLEELREALPLKLDRIMLDNMSLEEMREAVAITQGRVPLEASGNISLDNIADVAATGVGYISIGALTHSAKALDISLLLHAVTDGSV